MNDHILVFISLWMDLCCGCVTHVCVGVLSLGLGDRGVTVRAVVLTVVIGSLGVGGDQQLLDISLWKKRNRFPAASTITGHYVNFYGGKYNINVLFYFDLLFIIHILHCTITFIHVPVLFMFYYQGSRFKAFIGHTNIANM